MVLVCIARYISKDVFEFPTLDTKHNLSSTNLSKIFEKEETFRVELNRARERVCENTKVFANMNSNKSSRRSSMHGALTAAESTIKKTRHFFWIHSSSEFLSSRAYLGLAVSAHPNTEDSKIAIATATAHFAEYPRGGLSWVTACHCSLTWIYENRSTMDEAGLALVKRLEGVYQANSKTKVASDLLFDVTADTSMVTIEYHKEVMTLLATSEEIQRQLVAFAEKIEPIAATAVENRGL